MRVLFLSTLSALYLFGATEQSGSIVNEVAKLRLKYEECKAGQSSVLGIEPKLYAQCEKERKESTAKIRGYQSRIANLEAQIEQSYSELNRLKKRNTEVEREITQKRGVIQSLEQTLKTRDANYRAEVERNQVLSEQTNMTKVSRIERKNLTDSLNKAKFEIERLENVIAKTTKERTRLEQELTTARAQVDKFRNTKMPSTAVTAEVKKVAPLSDQSGKIKALQTELTRANALITELQNTPKTNIKERIVTKVVEPTEKIAALQRELSAAQATIANLKKGSKGVVQERIVEKVVTKVVEPTEKIAALQRELASVQAKLSNLKNNPSNTIVKEKIVEKIVYKDRPVIQEKVVEKVVYKDRPVVQEKVVVKSNDATEKLNRALQQKLAENEAQMEKLKAKTAKLVPPKTTKMTVQSVVVPEKTSKVLKVPELKSPVTTSTVSASKKSAPSAYRMATNAPIYNAPGGSVVDTWEARRSFTSGTVSNGWIKITGYFVNRVWQRADQELWVKESDVIRR